MTSFKDKMHQPFTWETLKSDVPSGLVVFLVALPLCLGIALASGTPPFSGLITGIIGGIIVSMLSGSSLSVSGPAAGLTVIVFTAVQNLGYEVFLLSVVLAGGMQILLGYARAGAIGHYFPSSVIKGMLAAIGLLLILKQIPHIFGYDEDFFGDFAFDQLDKQNTFTELLVAFSQLNYGAVMISGVSIAALILLDRSFMKKKLGILPAPLLVVGTAVLMNYLFTLFAPQLALSGKHLVQIPVATDVDDFLASFTLPQFGAIGQPQVWITAITLAIVASLETLLSVEAVDKLDPQKRVTPTNRELKAQGVGNIAAAMIGGLPMTAVIVRGSANINAGAKTKASAFFHALFLLLSVIFIPFVINKIPLACLAAILLIIGYKLTKVSLYREMYKTGRDQFLPFVITVLAILFTDLLIGISIGLAMGVFYILRRNMKNTYSYQRLQRKEGDPIHLVLSEEMSFLNKASVKLTLEHIPNGSQVIIDGSKSSYIDYDVLELIHNYKENAYRKNIEVKLINIQKVYKVSGDH